MGTVVLGKVESGGVMKGASLLLMPNRVSEMSGSCDSTHPGEKVHANTRKERWTPWKSVI